MAALSASSSIIITIKPNSKGKGSKSNCVHATFLRDRLAKVKKADAEKRFIRD